MFHALAYHGVYERREEIAGKPSREYVPLEEFKAQVRWLKASGYALLPIRDCRERWLAGALPARTICLTFDDGKLSDLRLVAPVLKEEGVSATFFVIPGWMGNRNIMRPAEVRELESLRMEIGSHSLTHPFLTELPDEDLRRELVDSRRILEDLLGSKVQSFAYPYGDVDARVRQAVGDAGYEAACGSQRGSNHASVDWLLLRRWGMIESAGQERLAKMLVRGEPNWVERGAERMKSLIGTSRYTRWRGRLLRKVRG